MQNRNESKNQKLQEIAALARNNNTEELKSLLGQSENRKSRYWKFCMDYDSREYFIECAARDALLSGNEEVMRILLDAGLDPDDLAYVDDKKHDRLPLIHFAVKSGKLDMVKLMVEYGAKIYWTRDKERCWNDNYGLRTAIVEGNADIVDYLLACGADANGLCNGYEFDGGKAFLASAAEDGNIHIVESLLKHGADIEEAIQLAHVKMYVEKYKVYVSAASRKHDRKQVEYQQKAEKYKNAYSRIVKTCLDYAMGCDFNPRWHTNKVGLSFLEDLDVSDMNFIGVSIGGQPITRRMLEERKQPGANHAIITIDDLRAMKDESRRFCLMSRLGAAWFKKGKLVNDAGIVNLVPLVSAASVGDISAVKTRLAAGEDPNLKRGSPLVCAAEKGHLEIVKLLYEAHVDHTANKTKKLLDEAHDFISAHPDAKSFVVSKGKVHVVPIPFVNDYCQLVLSKNKTLTSVMSIIKNWRKVSMENWLESIYSEAGTISENLIQVISPGCEAHSLKYDEYADHESIVQEIAHLIKSATEWRYSPPVFTNKNNFDVIKSLIISQYKKMDKSQTAMIEAIEVAREKKHADIVEFLESSQDINQHDKDGNTLLIKAVIKGELERVQALIQKGADVNLENNDKETPLIIAAKLSGNDYGYLSSKHAEIVGLLLDNKADPDKYHYDSPLELAVNAGNPDVVAMLLPVTTKKELSRKSLFSDKEIGRDPWYVDMMFTAVNKKECIALLELLKEHGADFNVKRQNDQTLLTSAVHNLPTFTSITRIMEDFVHCGYNHTGFEDAHENTHKKLLSDHEKYFAKNMKLLDYLLANGADPRLGGGDDQTPLALLIEKKDLSHLGKAAELVMERFLRHGADVNVRDSYGFTPLHEAAKTGDLVAIDYLVQHGALINAQNVHKRTPLHSAVLPANKETTQRLLELGADYTLLDEDKLTAKELAEQTMIHDRKIYHFSSIEAQLKFEAKYKEVQNIITRFANKQRLAKKRTVSSAGLDERDLQKFGLFASNQTTSTTQQVNITRAPGNFHGE